jgi:hypothetical protein
MYDHHYRMIGYDDKDRHLFVVDVVAPFSSVAQMMVLAQLHGNVKTSALVDKAARVEHATRRLTRRQFGLPFQAGVAEMPQPATFACDRLVG